MDHCKTDFEIYEIKGKVSSMRETKYSAEDKFGKAQRKEFVYDDIMRIAEHISFEADGQIGFRHK
ncbi:MAG TPA: hypothetical protein PL126_08685 [Candidatus Cloacimonadota bacterium]|nr:hypothetical protein [Candidatus Cloacimonadota bacterium]